MIWLLAVKGSFVSCQLHKSYTDMLMTRILMTYIAIAIAVFSYSACTVVFKPSPTFKAVKGYDFRDYSAKGFLFTPHQYEGAYESIGMIMVHRIPGTAVKSGAKPPSGWMEKELVGVTGGNSERHYWEEDIKASDVIEAAYKQAIAMGADALMDFTISSKEIIRGGAVQIKYEVSGFAIKRN